MRIWWMSCGLIVLILALVWYARPLGEAAWRRVAGRSSTVPPPIGPVFTSAPTIEQVQQLSELVSLRVRVVDIMTVEQAGWLAGYKGAWLIKGDALWMTNLEAAQIKEVSSLTGQKSVRIQLQRPEVRWARLDHAQTRTYDLQSKAWLPLIPVPEVVRDEAMRQGQRMVEDAARRDEYRREAERRTESVLATFYASCGVPVEIVWGEPATAFASPAETR